MFSFKFPPFILLGLALSCAAQDLRVAGPVTGLVHDPSSQSLRLILGVPGAARLESPLISSVDWASVGPNGRLALALHHGETFLVSYDPATAELTQTPIEGALGAPSLAAWSADSSALTVYSGKSRRLQWIHLTPYGAFAAPALPLAGLDGAVTALATGKGCSKAAVAVDGGGVFLVDSYASLQPVLPTADAAAIEVGPGCQTIWAATRQTGEIVQVNLASDEPASEILFADPDRLADVSALALSSNQRRLYVADRASSRLVVFDLASASITSEIALDAPVTALSPAGRSSVLLLGPRSNPADPFYLVEDSGEPALFFIPAAGVDIQ